MNSIIEKLQFFIKEEKRDLEKFKNLKVILLKHLILKSKKMKNLSIKEFIHYIDDIRNYIKNEDNRVNEDTIILLDEIEAFLYKNTTLSF